MQARRRIPCLKISLLMVMMGIIIFNQSIPGITARAESVPGKNYDGNQNPQDGAVDYAFADNTLISLTSSQNISLSMNIQETVQNRFLGLNIRSQNTTNISIQILGDFPNTPKQKMNAFRYGDPATPPKPTATLFSNEPTIPVSARPQDEKPVGYNYNTVVVIDYEGSVEGIDIFTKINENYGISDENTAGLSWTIYDNSSDSWYLLDSDTDGEVLSTVLENTDVENQQFILSVVYFPVEEPTVWQTPTGWLIIGLIVMIGIFGLIMTKQEYRSYLLNRFLPINAGVHRLSMEQVLENENRNQIINQILDEPGIHFNELLRRVKITAGTMAWHLDILETFKIIRKHRVGQYLNYYPYFDKNPISKLDPKLQKSRTTLEILQIVNDHPGVYQNQIAKRLDLNHKTVKYHLEKLLEAETISFEKKGRKRLFYPVEGILSDN